MRSRAGKKDRARDDEDDEEDAEVLAEDEVEAAEEESADGGGGNAFALSPYIPLPLSLSLFLAPLFREGDTHASFSFSLARSLSRLANLPGMLIPGALILTNISLVPARPRARSRG